MAGWCALGVWLALGSIGASAGTCDRVPSDHALVLGVTDGNTLRLNDDTELRLINTLAPTAARQAQAAQRLLHDELHGRRVHFASGGRQTDRHGRRLAHVFRNGDGTGWIQGELVDRGLARVYSFADSRACVAELLERESASREARLGLWADPQETILPAGSPGRLLAKAGRFVIVEGEVLSVGERRRRTYLDFGSNWNEDFTVIVSGSDRDRIAEAGVTFGDLQGHTIRVRGWVLEERGPAIMVTHPEQIEIVEE